MLAILASTPRERVETAYVLLSTRVDHHGETSHETTTANAFLKKNIRGAHIVDFNQRVDYIEGTNNSRVWNASSPLFRPNPRNRDRL